MKNLLVFSFFPAFAPPSSGGEVRLFHFYCELSRHFNITLLSSAQLSGDLEEVWHTNNFVEIRVPKDNNFATQWQRLSPSAGDGDLSGPSIAAAGKYLTDLHNAYLAAYSNIDLIIHESPFTLYYDLFRGLDDKPRIYNSYNCEYELYKKLHASSASGDIAALVQEVEKELLLSADLVTYCGEDDLKSFEAITCRPLTKTLFSPNGMISKAAPRLKEQRKLKNVVFIGSGHLPNVQAAQYIVKHIAPSCPEFTFDVIGDCLPPGKYPSNVVRHGLVDGSKKSELISNADIAINPMLSGGGSSLKILDFVAHGVPVLSTPIGMRGFELKNGTDCVLIDIKDFVRELKSYSGKCIQLTAIAGSAYQFALKHYTWFAIANNFRKCVDELLEADSVKGKTQQYILALNDYDPFSAIGGGATRLQGLYTAAAEWSRVIVMCFSDNAKIEVTKESLNIYCIRIPKTQEHIDEESYLNSRFHISTNDIVALRHVDRNQIFKDVYALLRKQARIVICDHPYMSPLPIAWSDRFVYSSQNFEYGLKKDLLEWHPDKASLLNDVRAAERTCVASAAAVVVVSSQDGHDLVYGMKAAAPIMVVANGACTPAKPSPEDVSAVKKYITSKSAVFIGSAHMPNVDAAKFIIESLALQCLDVDFHIVGSVCQALPKNLPSNVKAWGVLSESMKAAVLAQCSIAINPMFSGSGSNVKLADFLANGLYVVSTEFGVRGYPNEIFKHVSVSDRANFSTALREAIIRPATINATNRSSRHKLFLEHLSMLGLGTRFVKLLKNIETRKKRMLFVTYRYTYPYQGGAESYLAKLINSAGESGEFIVDVIAPEVSTIKENFRFSSSYEFNSDLSAPPEMDSVRFARFPLALQDANVTNEKLALAWRAQTEFEKQLYRSSSPSFSKSGLAWGWAYPAGGVAGSGRWSFTECGLYISETCRVQIAGFVRHPSILRILDTSGNELLHKKLESAFEIDFEAGKGFVELYCSHTGGMFAEDPRPLAIYVKTISLNGLPIDLDAPTLPPTREDDALKTYIGMEAAARASRGRSGVSLTEMRGPHSPNLESFMERAVGDYDIVVTHNNVFRPAIAAVKAANAAGVPVILLPHAHLDDDFYHFPDVHQAALDADMVLACPKAACAFYEKIGAKNVMYHSPGIDVREEFTDEDVAAFAEVHNSKKPFFLVLGRKAGAKGYATVISEIEKVAAKIDVHLVMIGPDDDGTPIKSKSTTYLGQQPRSVVRGALRSCIALVNMSSSESFGMVLLEAWLAGKPVVVNGGCSAFLDLAVHEKNALIVSRESLGKALTRLVTDKALGDRLGSAGRETSKKYEWKNVCAEFLDNCNSLINQPQDKHELLGKN
jgi:glycosyltransferase involved in cell wall biosynthesis